ANQHTFGVRQVSDDFLDRSWQAPNQSGNSDDLISAGQLRIFKQINDFDAISSAHVLLAELLEIAKGRDRVGCVTGDVEAQLPFHGFLVRASFCRLAPTRRVPKARVLPATVVLCIALGFRHRAFLRAPAVCAAARARSSSSNIWIPSSVISNCSILRECITPRDVSRWMARCRSGAAVLTSRTRTSISRSRIQLSMSEEIPTAVSSTIPLMVRLVNSAVMLLIFRKSMRRVSIDFTAKASPTETRFVIGSTTTIAGLKATTSRCI